MSGDDERHVGDEPPTRRADSATGRRAPRSDGEHDNGEPAPDARTGPDPPGHAGVGPDQAIRLLSAAIAGEPRPVDGVIERLNAGASAGWLRASLASSAGLSESEIEATRDATLDVARLRRAKERCKESLSEARTPDEQRAATAAYFLVLASALAGHDEHISSHDRADLDAVLVDLSEALPHAWGSMVARATER